MPDPVLPCAVSWHHRCPHFTDEETELQAGDITGENSCSLHPVMVKLVILIEIVDELLEARILHLFDFILRHAFYLLVPVQFRTFYGLIFSDEVPIYLVNSWIDRIIHGIRRITLIYNVICSR